MPACSHAVASTAQWRSEDTNVGWGHEVSVGQGFGRKKAPLVPPLTYNFEAAFVRRNHKGRPIANFRTLRNLGPPPQG